MKLFNFIVSWSLESKGLYYKLTIIFALFFLVPILCLTYYAVNYNLLADEFTPLIAIALFLSSLFGFTMIRKIFDEILTASKNITESVTKDIGTIGPASVTSELQGIVQSFHTVEHELLKSFRNLDKRVSQISTLKELSDLCYVTFNADDLFDITLERALRLTNADIGSILILEQPKREAFIVQACIGLGRILQKSDRVNFEESIAKYAVINKSPLLIDNIETDMRFGRSNRNHYGTKSFLCMPLKGIKEVIGVLSLSRRDSELPFTQDDTEVLASLLSNAAFAYDNLGLLRDDEIKSRHLKIVDDIHQILKSSLRNSELRHSLLEQLHADTPFDIAMILSHNENNPEQLTLIDFLSFIPTELNSQTEYLFQDSIIDRVIKQGTVLLTDDPSQWTRPIEQVMFDQHHLQACLLFPLKSESKVMGVVVVGACSADMMQGSKERIARIVDLIAMAMEKDNLLAMVLKRNKEMALIMQIGGLLAASTFKMQEVLEHTMELIRATLDVEAGSLLLLDQEELVFKVSFNMFNDVRMEALQAVRLTLGQGIAGYSAARGESIIVNDPEESPHFSRYYDEQTNFKTRAALCVPLISQGKVLGVIEVLNKKDGDFNEKDMLLLQSIATTVSIALENARLYHETVSMAEHERSIRNMFQKFVPKEVIDKITGDASEKPLLEELKTLTFLNIDIRGFSILTQNIGPKRTVSMLNYFFGAMGEIVFKYHGIVDKYLGDGFLAIFGAPVAGIMDADNAIISALEMKEKMIKINDDFQREFDVTLTMGISIHTGEAVVGNIGFDKKMDYTVIGDSVNVVFRIQEMTKSWPNSILISENTKQSVIQSSLDLREIVSYSSSEVISGMKIYELLDRKSRESKIYGIS